MKRITTVVAAVAVLILAGAIAIPADAKVAQAPIAKIPVIASVALSIVTGLTPTGHGQVIGDGSTAYLMGSATLKGFTVVIESPIQELSIRITPPQDEKLRAGRWSGISENDPLPGKPSVSGAGSYFRNGELNILDIAVDAKGTISRLDLTLQSSSTDATLAAFGEVRLGEPADVGSVKLGFQHLTWPLTPKHATPLYAVESLHNTSSKAVKLGRSTLTGLSATSYALSDDTCSGRILAGGATCTVRVGFAPRGGGPLVATLSIPIGSTVRRVDLAGTGMVGTTSFSFGGNDWVSSGVTDGSVTESHSFTEGADDLLSLGLRPGTATFGFSQTRLYTEITSPFGVTASDLGDGNYQVIVAGNGRRCNRVIDHSTIRGLAVDETGAAIRAQIVIDQQCAETPGPTMHGVLDYQYRADVTPPAAVTRIAATTETRPTISWTPSVDATRTTIARLVKGDGTNATPTSGYALSSGATRSVRAPTLTPNAHYTVAIFTVDTTGNVSAPATVHLVG